MSTQSGDSRTETAMFDDLGICPKCGMKLLRVWGHGWDWDKASCPAMGCGYERELDEMTGRDPDGKIWQMKKSSDE